MAPPEVVSNGLGHGSSIKYRPLTRSGGGQIEGVAHPCCARETVTVWPYADKFICIAFRVTLSSRSGIRWAINQTCPHYLTIHTSNCRPMHTTAQYTKPRATLDARNPELSTYQRTHFSSHAHAV